MRRLKISIAAAVSSMLLVSSPAFAQSFSLSSSTNLGGPVTFTGNSVDLSQSININCKVTVNGTVQASPSHEIAVTSQSISAGNLFCGVLVYPYLPTHPWKIEAVDSVGQLVKVFVSANTTTNKPCAGWINAAIGPDQKTVNVVGTIPAINPSHPSCNISGNIVANKPVYVL